jgi:hypothetical protein
MATITLFTDANAAALYAECQTALALIAEKHGMTVCKNKQKCRYNGGELPLNFSFIAASADGAKPMTREAKALVQFGQIYRLGENLLDTEVTIRGVAYKLSGFSPRASTYPVFAQRVPDGKEFKFRVDDVRTALEQKAA